MAFLEGGRLASASRRGWLWLGAMSPNAAGLYWLEDAAEKRAEDRRSALNEQAAGHLRPRMADSLSARLGATRRHAQLAGAR